MNKIFKHKIKTKKLILIKYFFSHPCEIKKECEIFNLKDLKEYYCSKRPYSLDKKIKTSYNSVEEHLTKEDLFIESDYNGRLAFRERFKN